MVYLLQKVPPNHTYSPQASPPPQCAQESNIYSEFSPAIQGSIDSGDCDELKNDVALGDLQSKLWAVHWYFLFSSNLCDFICLFFLKK